MTTSSLIILADRGGLKAYPVTETPTRGPSLRLVDEFQITGAERELPFNVESSQRHVISHERLDGARGGNKLPGLPATGGANREGGEDWTR